jgi:hypothetical protein
LAKIDALKNDSAIGNMINYRSALKRIELFAGDRIDLWEITPDWLRGFEKHLLNGGKSYVTISMTIRCIKAIINDAIRAKTLKQSQYPFGENLYKVPTGEGRKIALTLKQIKEFGSVSI